MHKTTFIVFFTLAIVLNYASSSSETNYNIEKEKIII